MTIRHPRSTADFSVWRKRGLFVPVFWPKKKIASHLSKSLSTQVPTGEPVTFFSPTEVVSWHMFELSGRLLCPYRRAKSAKR